MEKEEDVNSVRYSQPVSVSVSIHQLHEFLGKQIEDQNTRKGKDSTIKYQKFYSYCHKMLGPRKNLNFHDLNSKLKGNQLLELFDELKDSQKKKVNAKIRYLQNKIWDLDLNELQSIKALIPAYNQLLDKLKGLRDSERKQFEFQSIIQEVANDLNANSATQ